MPLVYIYYNPDTCKSIWEYAPDRKKFGMELRKIVARELNVKDREEARLVPEDIEVKFSPNKPEDITNYDFEIVIFAPYFKERAVNLGNKVEVIRFSVFQQLSVQEKINYFVYVQLGEAGFSEHLEK